MDSERQTIIDTEDAIEARNVNQSKWRRHKKHTGMNVRIQKTTE